MKVCCVKNAQIICGKVAKIFYAVTLSIIMKEVTLATIAARTGFSAKHVSRALSGSGRVSVESRRVIQETARQLGYCKSTRHTNRVAVISSFYFHWVDRLLKELAKQGLQGVFWRIDFLDSLPENMFDSAIGICTRDLLSNTWYSKFNIPLLLIHDTGVYTESISAVSGDFDADMFLAVNTLVKHGHRRIIWCRDNWQYSGTRFAARGVNGFYNAAGQNNIKENVLIRDFCNPGELQEILDKLLQEGYTAFIVNLYRNFQWLLDFFKSRNLRIPQDISLIVYDNNNSAGSCDPPLSSFELAYDLINKQAVKMVQKIDKLAPQQISVPSHFTDRNSVGPVKK